MDEARFIEASVALQLGRVLDRKLVQTPEAKVQALAGSSGSALIWLSTQGRPAPANGWRLLKGERSDTFESVALGNRTSGLEKARGALRSLVAAGIRSDVLIDMQDRRLRNLALPDGAILPCFSFNRETHSDQRVLWPLPLYHDLDSDGFLGPSKWTRTRWRDKADHIVWRGIHSGRPDPHGDPRRQGMRLKPLLRKFDQGEMSHDQVMQILDWVPRHRLVQRYIDDPRFNIGFTGALQNVPLKNYHFMQHLIRPGLTQQEMQRSKYILVLPGMDVGSSFYWTMNSGSLGLVMESHFESFASGHFRPWEHYVPFKADLSDFEERLSWCCSHDSECEEMALRAQDVCAYLARGDLRVEIAKEIVARVDTRVRECRP